MLCSRLFYRTQLGHRRRLKSLKPKPDKYHIVPEGVREREGGGRETDKTQSERHSHFLPITLHPEWRRNMRCHGKRSKQSLIHVSVNILKVLPPRARLPLPIKSTGIKTGQKYHSTIIYFQAATSSISALSESDQSNSVLHPRKMGLWKLIQRDNDNPLL